jgi:pyrroline-5-carboxylate reductase
MTFSLVIVGGGRMGGALASGLLASSWCDAQALCVVEHDATRRDELARLLPGVAVRAELELADVDEATGAVLAVKPDHAEVAARTLGALAVRRVVSVVAGMPAARLEAVFPAGVALVRAMPNTPVFVGKGVSAIAGGSHVTAADLDWAESILGAVGTVVRVTERNLDIVTGLSGAMPAYLYMIVESLIEAGVHQGLSRDLATTLVVDTFEGSGALLAQTGRSPESLRAEVTSPGGVTAAGLRVLESRAVRAAFLDAVAAANERARQLGR